MSITSMSKVPKKSKILSPVALSFTDVDFSYEKNLPLVLTDITFSIPRHTITAIVGASGGGKSTILRIVAGLISPTNGSVNLPLETRMIFQNSALLPWLTSYENVLFGLLATALSPAVQERRVKAALSVLGVTQLSNHYPRDLSGGERQRVGIARAIVSEPELLLLDEPFSALDIDTTATLTGLLEHLFTKKRVTMLMVSHSIENAVQLADRILVCKGGEIKEDIVVPFPRPRAVLTPEMLAFAHSIKL